MRHGEKLYEELLLGENPQQTEHPKIQRANDTFIVWDKLNLGLKNLSLLIEKGNVLEIVNLLKKLIQGYVWNGKLVDQLKNNKE